MKTIITIIVQYISCKCYLTLTMSVSYLPTPNKGNSENDKARGHINCTSQLLWSDKLEVSKFRLSLLTTMSNLATAKNTVPNKDAIPMNNAYILSKFYGNKYEFDIIYSCMLMYSIKLTTNYVNETFKLTKTTSYMGTMLYTRTNYTNDPYYVQENTNWWYDQITYYYIQNNEIDPTSYLKKFIIWLENQN